MRAEDVFLEASVVSRTPGQWERAAELYQEAAELLPVDDPRAFQSSVSAAQLFYHLGRTGTATRTMIDAARRAQEAGQVVNAAEAYVHAAEISLVAGREGDAQNFASPARRLASSPEITATERADILGRIEGLPGLRVQR